MSNPHVTGVIKDAGLVDFEWVTRDGLDRGTAVHRATQFYDEGDLDPRTVDPELVLPRLEAYIDFLRTARPTILAIEERVENDVYGYCGTLDRRLIIDGHEGVLDIKNGQPDRWHGVQLAAYARCFARPMRRWGLYLEDNKYTLIRYKDRHDWDVFRAAITLKNWMEK